jgi:hypothetical protein
MKIAFIVPVLAFIALLVAPTSSYALSCMDPEGMIKNYVEDSSYVIVTAKPTQNKEHVKEAAKKDDPNMSYDSGYTAQLLEISKAHKGSSPDTQWVYFERNGTWNYLCAGEPAKIGTENIYIIQQKSTMFDVSGVAGVYPVDSDIAKKLLKELASVDDENMEVPSVYETDKTYWLTQLHDELKDMAFLIKVKLAEWNFWKSTK